MFVFVVIWYAHISQK